jgi:antitoxin component of MazEF toxin-antitoxin module
MLTALHQLAFRLFPGGSEITPDQIRVRQRSGWVTIPKDQIHAVKARNVSHVIVRLFNGQRLVLNFFRFPVDEFLQLLRALRDSQRANEVARSAEGR